MKPIDRPATIQKTKHFLQDYPRWQSQAAGFSQLLAGHSNVQLTKQLARADYECQLRLKTITATQSLGPTMALYADLLTDRFIKQLTVKQTCVDLTSKQKYGFITERSCNRYQNKALPNFAYTCPRNLLVNS